MNSTVDPPKGLLGYLAIARQRRIWLIASFALGLLLTVALALFLPSRFRSAGTILIARQEMPQEVVRSTGTSCGDERGQVSSKGVMTTETLLGIIRRYDLYAKE